MRHRKLWEVAFLMICSTLGAQEWIESIDAYRLPEELFEVSVGDAEPGELSDVAWSVFDDVDSVELDRARVYWLRFQVPLFSRLQAEGAPALRDPVFVVESYETPVSMYINGREIVSLDPHVENRVHYRVFDDLVLLPSMTVHFRIESNPYAGEEIFLIERGRLREGPTPFLLQTIYSELLTAVFSTFVGLVGVAAIVVFLFRRSEPMVVWFGLFAIAYSVHSIFEGKLINSVVSIGPGIDFYASLVALDLMPLLLLFFYGAIAGKRARPILAVAAIAQVAVMSLRLYVMASAGFYEWADQLSLFFPIALYALVLVHILVTQRRSPVALLFGLAFLILGIAYGLQLASELFDLFGTLPIVVGPMVFVVLLGVVPVYSFFRSRDRIVEQADAFRKFVPAEFLSFLQREDITQVKIGDQVEREITILFSDIRSFTTISERLSPEENIDFLNRYLSSMGPIVRDHGGFIDKYIGDAIMALFPRHPDDAVRAAVAMSARLVTLNAEWAKRGLPYVAIGIGIHTGPTMLGIVGEAERYQGTVISDAVNLASRLESVTKKAKQTILLSGTTASRIKDSIPVKRIGKARLKGKSAETEIYAVVQTGPILGRGAIG